MKSLAHLAMILSTSKAFSTTNKLLLENSNLRGCQAWWTKGNNSFLKNQHFKTWSWIIQKDTYCCIFMCKMDSATICMDNNCHCGHATIEIKWRQCWIVCRKNLTYSGTSFCKSSVASSFKSSWSSLDICEWNPSSGHCSRIMLSSSAKARFSSSWLYFKAATKGGHKSK